MAREGEEGPRTANAGPEDHDGSMDKVTGPKSSGTELVPTKGLRAKSGHLERSWVAHRLVRDLAIGELPQNKLAEMYGVSGASITNFKKRHLYEIEEVRNNLADEYAGVWVAQKMERIRAYQQKVEEMLEGRTPRHAEVLMGLLKGVAEELGDLPARTQVNVSNETVTYQVVGIPLEDMK
jgi:hypothetical protein